MNIYIYEHAHTLTGVVYYTNAQYEYCTINHTVKLSLLLSKRKKKKRFHFNSYSFAVVSAKWKQWLKELKFSIFLERTHNEHYTCEMHETPACYSRFVSEPTHSFFQFLLSPSCYGVYTISVHTRLAKRFVHRTHTGQFCIYVIMIRRGSKIQGEKVLELQLHSCDWYVCAVIESLYWVLLANVSYDISKWQILMQYSAHIVLYNVITS